MLFDGIIVENEVYDFLFIQSDFHLNIRRFNVRIKFGKLRKLGIRNYIHFS